MENRKILMQLVNPFLIIAVAVTLRLVPHAPNFAPIAAMALFGGAHFNKEYALIVPLLALYISDLFLGFHATMPFVYASFLLTGLIGIWLKNKKSMHFVLGASLASSVLFFLITNFGVWLVGNLYPHTIQGLIKCFTLALPFFRNTILGDLFYVTLFFGSYEMATRLLKQPSRITSA